MTKPRPPVSIENTLYRVLGELGIERAAEVTGRQVSYLRELSDPDKRAELTMKDAIALDLACREAGDPTFPLYETQGLILQAEGAQRFSDAVAIGALAVSTAREGGEACAALVAVAFGPAGDRHSIKIALREAEQAREAYTDAIVTLQRQLAALESEAGQ